MENIKHIIQIEITHITQTRVHFFIEFSKEIDNNEIECTLVNKKNNTTLQQANLKDIFRI